MSISLFHCVVLTQLIDITHGATQEPKDATSNEILMTYTGGHYRFPLSLDCSAWLNIDNISAVNCLTIVLFSSGRRKIRDGNRNRFS